MGDGSIEDRTEEVAELLPSTLKMLETLRADATTPFNCLFGDGPAVIIREMDQGCVAFRDVPTQPLCPQHDVGRTPIEGDIPVVDLSVNAEWSKHRGHIPLYYINDDLELVAVEEKPFKD